MINGKLKKGKFGTVMFKNKKAYKYENLRMIGKTYNEKSAIIQGRRPYIKQSFVSGIQFISYIIQKYLYNLHKINSYVPNIQDIRFDFESKKPLSNKNLSLISEITMNLASMNKSKYNYSCTFKELFEIKIEEVFLYQKNNFALFILKILDKLCEILIFYQKKCCFIHRDIHCENFIINFNLSSIELINVIDFEIKLIDFMFSSFVINNRNGDKSILTYLTLRPNRELGIMNPYKNKNWECVDLKYLFLSFFLRYHLQSIRSEQVQSIFQILERIFNLEDTEYLNKFNEFKTNESLKDKYCFPLALHIDVMLLKNVHDMIFGTDFNYQLYNPNILNRLLKSEIIRMG